MYTGKTKKGEEMRLFKKKKKLKLTTGFLFSRGSAGIKLITLKKNGRNINLDNVFQRAVFPQKIPVPLLLAPDAKVNSSEPI